MTSGAELLTYIPLSEAAERYRLSAGALSRAVEHGTIKAVKINGDVAVAEEDLREIVDVREAVQVDESLQGKPIRVTEAAEKYEVNQVTLGRWADSGYIHIMKREPKLLLLDEADVKRAVEIFRQGLQESGSSIQAGWVLKRAMQKLKIQ
ncbi:MAG TPA: hypothetical protein ENN19_18690 [Chloroflexi bacterium]|nr:hypothetical protein [Chloroflexota bacterium]